MAHGPSDRDVELMRRLLLMIEEADPEALAPFRTRSPIGRLARTRATAHALKALRRNEGSPQWSETRADAWRVARTITSAVDSSTLLVGRYGRAYKSTGKHAALKALESAALATTVRGLISDEDYRNLVGPLEAALGPLAEMELL